MTALTLTSDPAPIKTAMAVLSLTHERYQELYNIAAEEIKISSKFNREYEDWTQQEQFVYEYLRLSFMQKLSNQKHK